MRSGVIAKKLGMTRLFMDDGQQIPVTVLQMENLQVVAQRTAEKDGYTAVQLGVGAAKAKNTSKAARGHFAAAKVEPKRKLAEFRVSADNLIEVGEEITGRVFKGKKMAGHMGAAKVTTQNLQVVKTDVERGLIMIKGAVPGSKGGWVTIKDAVKKATPENVIYPAALRSAAAAAEKAAEEAAAAAAAEEEAAAAAAAEAEQAAMDSAEATKKIYRQKGTGGARHGSRNAPIFRSGGVYKGPTPRSHAHDLTKKFRKLGLRHALSAKATAGELIVLDDATMKSSKTSDLAKNLKALGLKRALIIDHEPDANFAMAARNIDNVDVLPSIGANVYDILRRDTLVITKAGIEALEARLK